ncbi:MAG: antibiotic biosynthesis monooxygenase [Anaerolineales bacterium]|nr:MAG: antibiotic biosynthesis monooxygenase [Anaerolineales bacterium]
MIVAIINIHVKPESVELFKAATIDNARNSMKEPGVIRFDFYQQTDDSFRFVLVEIYKTEVDIAKHRDTAHYVRWRDSVADMMVEPRARNTYHIVYPPEAEW